MGLRHAGPSRGVGAVVGLAIGLTLACGGSGRGGGLSTPTGPTPTVPTLDPTCPPSATNPGCAPTSSLGFLIRVCASNSPNNCPNNGDGPYNFTVAGLTFSGTGTQYYRVLGISAGVYELSGSMSTTVLNFTLMANQSNVPGGVVAGTIEHLEGPLTPNIQPGSATPGITRCGIQYFRPTSVSAPVNIRFRFTVTAADQPENDPTACRGGNL